MLQTKAITVNLMISQWTARKHDKKITREVDQQHNATNAGRYNKLLIATDALKKVQQAVNAARIFHYENTLPWSDNGDRILPAANYFTYMQKMNDLKNEFSKEVNAFLANYDEVVLEAKIRLNGLFDNADYPSDTQIRSKFDFKTSFTPIPENDFRIEIGQTEINMLKNTLEREMKDRTAIAVTDIWNRISDQLKKMHERLSTADAVFRDSLFENLNDLIDLIPRLNITDSADIAAACEAMKILKVNPQAVRDNSILRKHKAEEVEEILNKFGSFFS